MLSVLKNVVYLQRRYCCSGFGNSGLVFYVNPLPFYIEDLWELGC